MTIDHPLANPGAGREDGPDRQCQECGSTLSTPGRFCSSRCGQLAWRRENGLLPEPHGCVVCDTQILTRARYCSSSCRNLASRLRCDRPAPEPHGCLICDTVILTRAKYCSSSCRKLDRQRRKQLTPSTSRAPEPSLAAPRLVSPDPNAPIPLEWQAVNECHECQRRFLGPRCPACLLPGNRLGLGGPCPHCQQPLLLTDLASNDPDIRPASSP